LPKGGEKKNMVKKLASLAGAGALLLSVAVPVLAWSSDVAFVNNSATAVAGTGLNVQGNGVTVTKASAGDINVRGNNSLTTGDADAYAGALVVANTRISCGRCGGGGRGHTDVAYVNNSAGAGASTGDNGQGNGVTVKKAFAGGINVSGNNRLTTGDATSKARAWTVVNTHWGY